VKNISIVIPVYNSENSIGGLCEQLIKSLSILYNLEIVLVNDRSKDNSDAVCVALFEKYPDRICFYSLAKNVGEHNAVMAGLNHATGDYVVIMDDDFQNPASEVPLLVEEAIRKGCDVVYSQYEEKKHSLFRNLGSSFNDAVANVMLKKPKHLYLSSFKVMSRFVVDQVIRYDLPFSYIDGLILRVTDNIGVVNVHHEERADGKSGYTLKKLVSLWLNMFTSFSILPLRVAIILGFIFSFLGLVLGIQTLIERIMNPNLPLGWSQLIVAVSIFAGVQLVAIGMTGEYVGRIFLSQSKKPQFTIRTAYEKKKALE